MKAFLIISLLIIFSTENIIAQQWRNFVPNYSLENISPDFNSIYGPVNNYCSPNCNYPFDGGPSYQYIKDYWSYVSEWTYPLQKIGCSGCPRVPTADLLTMVNNSAAGPSKSGSNWGHLYEEYLVVPTIDYSLGGIQKDKYYFIEVFQRGSASDGLYVVGYDQQPKACKYNPNKQMHEINVNKNHAQVFLTFDASNSSGWTRYKGYFKAVSNKNWLSFGSTGFWDDLRIYEVQENGCRDNWYFDNTEFNYSTEFFQAGQNIYVGTGVDPENGGNHIAGKVYIRSNSYVVLQAGQSVVINDLVMDPGSSKLLIENTPCGSNLCPNELSFPSQQLLCNINSKQIGASNASGWGTQVTWSPSTYLDNANSPNPTFTAPSTGAGTIEYTVSITYTCDAGFEYTSSQNVTVQYTHSSDPTATISASNINSSTYNYSADFNVSPGVTEINILTIGSPFSDPPYNETFYVGQDFSNGILNWTLGGNWSSCQNQDIQITTKNICSGASQSLTLNWTKTGSLSVGDIPNVLTLNNDGMNDEFCFSVDHADQYELIVTDRDGLDICDLSGNITSNPACIWDGYDYYHTQYVSTDTYSYILKLYNECAESIQEHGFIDIFNSLPGMALNSNETDNQNPYNVLLNSQDRDANRSNSFSNSNNSPTNNSSEEWYSIVPNPTNGFFKIIGTTKYITKIQIYDISGVFLFEEQDDLSLDISKYASGMYFVHIQTNTGIKILKVERK